MRKWMTMVLVVMLVLVGAMGLRNLMVANAGHSPVLMANGGAPLPPTPWNGGAPLPPTPWNGGAPLPPTPWNQ